MNNIREKLKKPSNKLPLCSSSRLKFNSKFKLNRTNLHLSNKNLGKPNRMQECLMVKLNRCNNNLNNKELKWRRKKNSLRLSLYLVKHKLLHIQIQTELAICLKPILKTFIHSYKDKCHSTNSQLNLEVSPANLNNNMDSSHKAMVSNIDNQDMLFLNSNMDNQ